jgi:hypothetical protein
MVAEKLTVAPLPQVLEEPEELLLDEGGGFDDIPIDEDGEGHDRLCEFIMTVRSTKRQNVCVFDACFKKGGRYRLDNIIEGEGVDSALRILCTLASANTFEYSILAYENSFRLTYAKIRTSFWLKFSLEVLTGRGEYADCEVLMEVLDPYGPNDITFGWEKFAPDGTWEAVRWNAREIANCFAYIPLYGKQVKTELKRNLRDPLTQALIKDRKYIEAFKRIVPI